MPIPTRYQLGPRLSIELWEEIIDQLAWATDTSSSSDALSSTRFASRISRTLIRQRRIDLGRYSLVCRSWLARARYHLFRTITLKLILTSLLDTGITDLLLHPKSTINHSILYLRIETECYEDADSVMKYLPGVRDLELSSTDMCLGSRLSFHAITRLSLYRCLFSSQAFVQSISLCRSLKALRLERVFFLPEGVYKSPSGDRPIDTKISTLIIKKVSPCLWPLLPLVTSAIQTLFIGSDDLYPHIYRYINDVGLSLKHVAVPHISVFSESFAQMMGISSATTLESITFTLISPCFGSLRHVPSVLASISSEFLRDVVIWINYGPYERLECCADWERIAAILEERRFGATRVTIGVMCQEDVIHAEKWKRNTKALDRLVERGRMKVEMRRCEDHFYEIL